jgi:cell division transport system permease protein
MSDAFQGSFRKTMKFFLTAALSALCVMILNHYFQMEQERRDIGSQLGVYVFLNKNASQEIAAQEIQALNGVAITDEVPSKEVYRRAVEKNPFLAEIAVPDAANAFQSYFVLSPQVLPDDAFMNSLKESLYKMEGVDELVYDQDLFWRYIKLSNDLLHCRIAVYIFAGLSLLFFLLSFALSFADRENEQNWKSFLVTFGVYLVAAIGGFWGVWGLFSILKLPMFVDQISSLIVIPFSAVLSISLKN